MDDPEKELRIETEDEHEGDGRREGDALAGSEGEGHVAHGPAVAIRIAEADVVEHEPLLDRHWYAARIRPAANPDFCKKGSDHPSAKVYPIETSGRQITMYDPKTEKFTMINTCYPTHHLQFAADANNTLWTSAGGPASQPRSCAHCCSAGPERSARVPATAESLTVTTATRIIF